MLNVQRKELYNLSKIKGFGFFVLREIMIYMNIGDFDIKESLNVENEFWVIEIILDFDIYFIEQ